MELRFDAMLCSKLGADNSDADRFKSTRGPHVPHPVPSPRGSFGGLSPPKQSSKPLQIEIWNTIHQWNFCQFLMSSLPPLHKRKVPPIDDFLSSPLLWCIRWSRGQVFNHQHRLYHGLLSSSTKRLETPHTCPRPQQQHRAPEKTTERTTDHLNAHNTKGNSHLPLRKILVNVWHLSDHTAKLKLVF